MINSTDTWSLEYAAAGARLRGFTTVLEEAGIKSRPELRA
jgi:hypothetical protein